MKIVQQRSQHTMPCCTLDGFSSLDIPSGGSVGPVASWLGHAGVLASASRSWLRRSEGSRLCLHRAGLPRPFQEGGLCPRAGADGLWRGSARCGARGGRLRAAQWLWELGGMGSAAFCRFGEVWSYSWAKAARSRGLYLHCISLGCH